jgi:hypothetical protein
MEEKKIEKFAVEICVGDEVNQKITAITLDKWGHPVIETSGGRKTGIFAKRLKKLIPEDVERKVDEKEYKEE